MKDALKKITAASLSSALLLCCLTACNKKEEDADLNGADIACEWSNLTIDGGGFVPGIVYSKVQEGLAYARTDIGGAYRYDKDKDKWIPLTDFFGQDEWNLIGIESIAADPIDPKRVYIACGTYANQNGCIISSADYGETWTRFNLDTYCGGNLSGRGVGERLMVDPNDNSIIYFGSRASGLYKSADYGETWSTVPSFPVKGNYMQEGNRVGIMWIVFDENTGKRAEGGNEASATTDIYVGVAQTDGNTIYRSSDAGESWAAIASPESGLYPLQADLSPNGKLYLSMSDNCGPNMSPTKGAVYAYNIKTGEFSNITPAGAGASHGFGGISIDAQNPDTVVVSTLGLWYPINDNIYRTTDGGASWSQFYRSAEEKYYTMDYTKTPWMEWAGDKFWWLTDIDINPFNSDELMFGTGAAILKTTNLTKLGSGTDVVLQANSDGIEETAVFEVLVPPGAPAAYTIMGDIAGFRHDTAGNAPSYQYMMSTKQVSTDIDCGWKNTDVVVRCGTGIPLLCSADGGATWNKAYPPAGYESYEGGTVAVSAEGTSFIWSPSDLAAKPVVTFDMGGTWSECSGLPRNASVAADRTDNSRFYACSDGSLYTSTDGGKSFVLQNGTVLDGSVMHTIGGFDNELWLAGSYLFRSEDNGATFTAVKTITADCIGFGKGQKDGEYAIYAMGKVDDIYGIYRSLDKGGTWKKLNGDTHLFGNPTHSIAGDPDIFGRFYFCTNGRGVIMGDSAGKEAK